MQTLANKWMHLQQLIDMFEHQADSFISQDYRGNSDIPSLEDYDQYDHVDNLDNDSGEGKAQLHSTSPEPISRTPDGSRMESANPEDHLIMLPSSLG